MSYNVTVTTINIEDIQRDLQSYLEKSRSGSSPWAKARLFDTRIRRNIKLAECPSFGQSIFAYAPKCPGAADYSELAREVLGDTLEVSATAPGRLSA